VVTELKIVGGDPALDLVNTRGDDRVADPLDAYASFAAWAARIGVIDDAVADRLTARASERPGAAERALTAGRALRAVMDAVFRPLATGHEAPHDSAAVPHDPSAPDDSSAARHDPSGALDDSWAPDEPPREALARRAGAAVERARLVPAGSGFALAWDGDHLERPLWPIAVAGLDLLRAGPLDRLKACEDCPWLFLDTSRNRSRRWCSMDDCGSRSKMRRYRARRATAGR
jgi:hypothetical protein